MTRCFQMLFVASLVATVFNVHSHRAWSGEKHRRTIHCQPCPAGTVLMLIGIRISYRKALLPRRRSTMGQQNAAETFRIVLVGKLAGTRQVEIIEARHPEA